MQTYKVKTKDLSIETLRGIAVIMMVAGHVVGASKGTGLHVEDDSGWRYFYDSFEYLRMPLFTVVSGFVYSLRPVEPGRLLEFLKGKGRRILFPLISVGTLHFLVQHIIPGTNANYEITDIWKIYLFKYEHFWFLQSIFLIFVIISVIDNYQLISTEKKWLVVFFICVLLRLTMPFLQGNFFSFKGCLNLLPFFVLGCGIERYKDLFNNKLVVRGLLVVFILAVSIHQLYLLNGKSFDRWDYAIMSFLVACPGIILLFHIRKDVPVLSKLGYYAYGIYLFHVFGTAGSRIVLMQLNITSITFLFSVGLLAGLGLPIVFEYFIEKSPLFRTVFLGLRKKTNW
ncbi:MAG TPA: acyltransferase [Desulfobacteraceae bacterium]|nr:acyltransferase [Desulfobacteraceae bacterium]HPQ27449.1 acyltransferase [Desulfobacteraceae bacterium]